MSLLHLAVHELKEGHDERADGAGEDVATEKELNGISKGVTLRHDMAGAHKDAQVPWGEAICRGPLLHLLQHGLHLLLRTRHFLFC